MKRLSTIFFALMIAIGANAQNGNGTIMGYVYGSDSTSTVPFAKVWIDYNGDVLGVTADVTGKYKISAVNAGKYNLHATAPIEGKKTLNGINVYAESIAKHNLYLTRDSMLTEVVVSGEPMIKLDPIKTIPLDMIKNSPNIQNPSKMITDFNSDVTLNQNNQMIIRGSRPGDVVYFVDGVKQTNMQAVPGVAIRSMSVYTGGVPAKYGDTMGGVVILETKGYFDMYYAWKARQ